MNLAERYSFDKMEWEQISNLNRKRIGAATCAMGENHIYVFGGRDDVDTFYDSVERYNIKLNLWNELNIRMPQKLCNLFAFRISEDNIILMGGLRIFDKESNDGQNENLLGDYIIESEVYLFNQKKELWY